MHASPESANRWQHAWYPVAFLRDLNPQRPTPFTLMGKTWCCGSSAAAAIGGPWRMCARTG